MNTTVIITGSRTWRQRSFIYAAMDVLLVWRPGLVRVRNGKCPKGADRMVHDWTNLRLRQGEAVREIPHPADWDRYGRRAGFIRNKEMVDAGADWCVAFIDRCMKPDCKIPEVHGSHGAEGCADLAEAAGIRTKRFRTF